MKNKIVQNMRKCRVRGATCVAMFAMGVLIGCSDTEGSAVSSVPTKQPMSTEEPAATQQPSSMEIPTTTEAPTSASVPSSDGQPQETATPTPEVLEEQEYPALKADGNGWGLYYFEQGVQPRGNEAVDTLVEYHAYYMGNPEDKVIYLTFDCGYENGNTDAILNALKEHDVKGTFFVTGSFLEKQPELVKRMIEEGHAVGSHSYTHPDITKLDEQAFREELDSVKNKFYEVTGTELSMYFRPPEGKCYSEDMKWSKDMGYATIFWSLAHVDWDTQNQPDPEDALEKLTDRIHPGAVVLLHNTSKTNGEILNELIAKWEELGYTIMPLSDLTGQ